jgi:histidinol dehydrogenase
VLCTPPDSTGSVPAAILVAARLAGIDAVYAVGGAQAIAAMAYGTATIPRVDKIFGPGNQWVDTAKRLVASDGVAIDLPAGPTEVGILMDEGANLSFVAADILSQAEHGTDSDVFVVACGPVDAQGLLAEVERQLADLPRAEVARKSLETSRLVVCSTRKEAVALMNAYAPEHLIIQTHHAAALAEEITQAGSVFIGAWTPESLGDYASGTNHTLPTNGAARAFSGVSLDSFVRKITYQEASPAGLAGLGPHVETLARAELLEGHARAVSARLAFAPAAVGRTGFVRRKTNETDIVVQVDLDGSGRGDIHTGLGFLDHMLDQIARHARIDLSLRCYGDLEVDEHHTVEDTALALGSALDQALGERRGIHRFGFTAPMDEALAQVAIDFSGRAWLVWDVSFEREKIGDVPTEMFFHFFKSLSDNARMNLNIRADGENEHHIIESVFKGFARALGMAIRPTGTNDLPSTKGSL